MDTTEDEGGLTPNEVQMVETAHTLFDHHASTFHEITDAIVPRIEQHFAARCLNGPVDQCLECLVLYAAKLGAIIGANVAAASARGLTAAMPTPAVIEGFAADEFSDCPHGAADVIDLEDYR